MVVVVAGVVVAGVVVAGVVEVAIVVVVAAVVVATCWLRRVSSSWMKACRFCPDIMVF